MCIMNRKFYNDQKKKIRAQDQKTCTTKQHGSSVINSSPNKEVILILANET